MPDVFFYGLFMDRALLIERGLHPVNERPAKVEGYSLRIGNRATLAPTPDANVHGIVMTLSQAEIESLYSEASVRDYRPEPVTAMFADGSAAPVLCFILPEPPTPDEHNQVYADTLRALARRLGLPTEYVKSIK